MNEEYQPTKTLAFLYSRGQEFHKWGPLDNFLLAPGYAFTVWFWRVTGSLGNISQGFPYGLKDPIHQLSFLILQSRIELLALCLAGSAYLLQRLGKITGSAWAVFFAGIFCIGTNPILSASLVTLKADGIMAICCGIAMLNYMEMLRDGMTPLRGFWFSSWAAWAIVAKEIAIPLFFLPYLGLTFRGLRAGRSFSRTLLIMLGTLISWYVLLDVAYAPATWLRRVRFWLLGSGKDPAVWGAPDRGFFLYIAEIGRGLLDNFGPAGTVVVLLGVTGFLRSKERDKTMLLLPFFSFLLLGILPAGYAPAYFFIPMAIVLAPIVALGLKALIDRQHRGRRPVVLAALFLGLVVNSWWANIVWVAPYQSAGVLMERYVIQHIGRDQPINEFSFWTTPAGKSRLSYLGYKVDGRSIQNIMQDQLQHSTSEPSQRPEYIFVDERFQRFLNECASRPKRAAMFEAESGFRYRDWHGMSALGYRQTATIAPQLPMWYPFTFMPAAQAALSDKVDVYRKTP